MRDPVYSATTYQAGHFFKKTYIVWLGDKKTTEAQCQVISNGVQELSHSMDNCVKYSLKAYSQFILFLSITRGKETQEERIAGAQNKSTV